MVNDCFEVFDYDSKKMLHDSQMTSILTIEWKPQNRLNSLRIIYTFPKNMYFDINIGVYDEFNNTNCLQTISNTDVSIKYNYLYMIADSVVVIKIYS